MCSVDSNSVFCQENMLRTAAYKVILIFDWDISQLYLCEPKISSYRLLFLALPLDLC